MIKALELIGTGLVTTGFIIVGPLFSTGLVHDDLIFFGLDVKGVKSSDYVDFVKVALLMKDNCHLTREVLEQIRQIKSWLILR